MTDSDMTDGDDPETARQSSSLTGLIVALVLIVLGLLLVERAPSPRGTGGLPAGGADQLRGADRRSRLIGRCNAGEP